MNPYVTSIIVGQRQRDLRSESVTGRLARAAAPNGAASPSSGVALRLRQAIAGAWSLAAATEPALPRLRDYPYTPGI